MLLKTLDLKRGEVISYGELAGLLGNVRSARAVGRALAKNPYPIEVPCHRIVAKNGLGGYRWGVDKKRELLKREMKCV